MFGTLVAGRGGGRRPRRGLEAVQVVQAEHRVDAEVGGDGRGGRVRVEGDAVRRVAVQRRRERRLHLRGRAGREQVVGRGLDACDLEPGALEPGLGRGGRRRRDAVLLVERVRVEVRAVAGARRVVEPLQVRVLGGLVRVRQEDADGDRLRRSDRAEQRGVAEVLDRVTAEPHGRRAGARGRRARARTEEDRHAGEYERAEAPRAPPRLERHNGYLLVHHLSGC